MALTLAMVMGALWAPSAAAATPVPVKDFVRWPALRSPQLSPDGKQIAMIVPGPEGRQVLAVAPVDAPTKPVGVARFSDADVAMFSWVNDKRLVMSLVDFQTPLGDQWGGGLYAVDADGSNFVWLIGRGRKEESGGHGVRDRVGAQPLLGNHRLVKMLRDGSDDVVVLRFNRETTLTQDFGSLTPMRLNTRTKAVSRLVADEPRNGSGWVFDHRGEARAMVTIADGRKATVSARAGADAPWQTIAEYDIYDVRASALEPVAADDQGLIVRAVRGDDAGTYAMYRYDLAKKTMAPQPMLAVDGFDFEGGIIVERPSGRLLGASYLADAPGVAWFDPALRDIQARIDKLLPGTVNVFSCDPCGDQQRFVVTALSDRQPPVHFLFDRKAEGAKSLTLIGSSRPWIDDRRMAQQDFVRIKTRDGESMPVYVTKPQGKGPWPTVVLVHGGPWVRGASWGWNSDSQFLASRGYLVVEPEFRGSTGYGHRWFLKGMRQWGLAMQDDVTDATKWAIEQRLADPKRIAIAGASYGGYATMMGLVKEPDLYKAGINWVGVTDIDLMYTVSWSDLPDEWRRYGMPGLIGDPVKDREQLNRTSPLKRAAEIKVPVLMAYGGKDVRVPLPHGTEMRDALKKAGKVEVEWIEYPDEGHGFLLEENRVDFWTRVERFLAKHLK